MPKKICLNDYKLHNYNNDVTKKWFVWYYDANDPKKRIRIYGKINSLPDVESRLIEADRIIKQLQQKYGTVQQNLTTTKTVSNYIDEYLILKKNSIRESSWVSLRAIYENYFYFLKSNNYLSLNDIPFDHSRKYVQTLAQKHKTTQNKYRAALLMFWQWLIDEKIVQKDNPFAAIKRHKKSTTPYLYFQPYQIRKLKEYITENDPQLWLAIGFICYAFIRPKELRFMKVGDILLEENKILVRAEVSKNGRQQFVPMAKPLRQLIIDNKIMEYANNSYILGTKQHPDATPVSQNYLKNRHQSILKKMDIDTTYCKLYSWKHTGAIRNVNNGMNLRELQLMMRHHSLDETQRYLEALGHNSRSEIDKITPL